MSRHKIHIMLKLFPIDQSHWSTFAFSKQVLRAGPTVLSYVRSTGSVFTSVSAHRASLGAVCLVGVQPKPGE